MVGDRKKALEMTLNKGLMIRVTDKQKHVIQQAAKLKNLKTTAFMRALVLSTSQKIVKENKNK